MKLYAISDLHVGNADNRSAFGDIAEHRDDWLILGGDIGETLDHLRHVLDVATRRFARVIWVPGNHDLWTLPGVDGNARGQARYESLVRLCRGYDVVTPEDRFPVFTGEGGPCVVAPLFVLYDYSFRPDHVSRAGAIPWAMEDGILCTDEELLHPDPFSSRDAWCEERVRISEERLQRAQGEIPLVLVNHFPLRRDLVRIPRIPRFVIWCGTRRTEDWHTRFNAKVVVTGHLHVRATDWRDGVRFEEVSFGYPRQRREGRGIEDYLREILPGTDGPRPTKFHR